MMLLVHGIFCSLAALTLWFGVSARGFWSAPKAVRPTLREMFTPSNGGKVGSAVCVTIVLNNRPRFWCNNPLCWGEDVAYLSRCQPGRGLWRAGRSPSWTQTARSSPGMRGNSHHYPVLEQVYWTKERSSMSYGIIWCLWQFNAGTERM